MTATRPLALLTATLLALTACGGDDAPAADSSSVDEPADDSVAQEPIAEESAAEEPVEDGAGDGPVSTLSPDIPEEFLPGIGPVDVLGADLPPLEDPAEDPAVGLPAPVLVGLDLDGDPIRIDPAVDGPTMVVFVAHWCPHCNAEIPRLNELRDEGRFPEGLNIVAVSTAVSPDRPNWPPIEWLVDTMDWTYPAMLDGVDLENQAFLAAEAYGVTGFPFVTLVNADGTVATRWSGEREPDETVSLITSNLDLG